MAKSSKEMQIAIKIAGKVDKSLKSSLSTVTGGIKTIGKVAATVSAASVAAIAAIGAASVNVGKEFESAMSQVSATMLIDKTSEEGQKAYETLENAARECGSTTAYSATEAAEALNYLALAGYDADKAATALPTVLKLAGAGAMELADASDMVTDSMSALGIEATESNLTNFSDQMAKTASKANTSVSQLGEAILTVGGTAKYLAGGTTELNTTLGLLADNGIKGAEGGTKLRNMITSLTAPTDKARGALEELGISVFDAQGNMLGMEDIMGQFQTVMGGMSTEDQSAYLKTIFNKQDLKAVNALLGTSTERWDELTAAVENSSGACEDMYAIQLDNLDGDIAILKSGLSDLGISIYQDMNGPLRETTQMASDMVSELSAAYSEGGLQGMLGEVGDCLAQVVEEVAQYVPEMIQTGVDLVDSFLDGIDSNSDALGQSAADIITTFVSGAIKLAPKMLVVGAELAVSIGKGLIDDLPGVISSAFGSIGDVGQIDLSGLFGDIGPEVTTVFTSITTTVQTAMTNIAGAISSNQPAIQNIIDFATMLKDELFNAFNDPQSVINTLATSVLPSIVSAMLKVTGGAAKVLTTMNRWGILKPIIVGLAAVIGTVKMVKFASDVGKATKAFLSAKSALVALKLEKIKENVETIKQQALAAKDVIVKAASTAATIAQTVATAAWNVVCTAATAVTSALGAAFAFLTSPIGIAIIAITAIIAIGVLLYKNWDTVKAKALQLGTMLAQTFNNIKAAISAAINSLAARFPAAFAIIGAYFNSWKNSIMNVVNGVKQIFNGIINFVTGIFTGNWTQAWQGLVSIFTGIFQTLTSLVTAPLQAIWDTIVTIFGTIGTAVGDAISGAVSGAINSVLSGAIGIINGFIGAINSVIGVINDIPGVKIGKLDTLSVPQLAQGGIATAPTLAEIGEGKQNEAVLPLDTLWSKMSSIMQNIISKNNGSSLISALVEKLQGIGSGGSGGSGSEFAGAGGPNISYSPTYNLYGSATKEDAVEAEKVSQADFNRMMKQWQKDKNRTKF